MKIKKLLCMLLVLLTVSTMTLAVQADETGKCSFTVQNAATGKEYKLYQLFSMTKVSDTQYDYTVTDDWENFFTTGAGSAYISLNNKHPNWIKEEYNNQPRQEDVRKLAELAQIYAEGTQNLTFVSKNAVNETVTFENLDSGYYFLDSPAGTRCFLWSIGENVKVAEKNEAPSVEKKVSAAENGTLGENLTSQVGDTLYFTTTITVGEGTINYTLHDYPEAGITVDPNSVKVTVNGVAIAPAQETYTQSENKDCKWTHNSIELQCAFEIQFSNSFLTTGKTIEVTYQGKLNGAVDTVNGSRNYARLIHSGGEEVDDAVVTTLGFDLIKLRKTNDLNQQLSGAKFKLYSEETGGSPIKLVKLADDKYRLAMENEQSAMEEIETKGTPIYVYGLKKQSYYLEETQAPVDFNPLKTREVVNLTEGSARYSLINEETRTIKGGIQVINQMGTQLPSTGGTGTTVFYILGGGIAIAALVLLIVKKRMDREA